MTVQISPKKVTAMATMNNTTFFYQLAQQSETQIFYTAAMGNKLDFSLIKQVTVFLGRQVGCTVHQSYKGLGSETERRMEQH